LSQWLAKTAVEVFFTPVTYKLVAFLKRAEQEDFFDRDTDFTPFQIKT
ncbi:MAG: VUT family protein, partial [Betaproteobacteria bacterium]|nr:VUT family protein [Betaproteobacteria bacterium]